VNNTNETHLIIAFVLEQVEGLVNKSDYSEVVKGEMRSVLEQIQVKGYHTIEFDANDHRAPIVGLQEIFETVFLFLENPMMMVVHTQSVPTPLTLEPGSDDVDSVFPLQGATIDAKQTVLKRLVSVRKLLEQTNKTLFSIYSAGGREVRTSVQLTCFDNFCQSEKGRNKVFTYELNETIPTDLSGATYLTSSFAFCIDAQQANHAGAVKKWGIYFAPLSIEVIKNRVLTVLDYIEAHSQLNVKEKIKSETGLTL